MSSCTKALLAAALLTLSACTTPGVPQPEPPPPTTAAEPAPTVSAVPQPEPEPTASLMDSFTAMRQQLPAGRVGIAMSDGATASSFGDWSTGAGWSTIKVPLAIAALRLSPDAASDVAAAITVSDNAAADRLWALLGTPDQAAAAVREVLRDGGDEDTAVQSQQVRPPYSAYGQTQWSAAHAARFAFELPCVAGSETVLTAMGDLGGNQMWGLAAQPGVAAKGGWGPGPGGGYLVRQLALVSGEGGSVGVALAAEPDDGRFETGTAMLDGLGQWFVEHAHNFSTATCHS